MDKNILSNYGWIVVMILCLSVLIALATPFGGYIKAGVENTLDGLFETQESALDVVYNKTITPNELEEKGYEFYSTLALAVEDANGLTTANADVEKENKETAVAGLKINGEEASIVLINDSDNTDNLNPTVSLLLNLNNKTINFNETAYISSSMDLMIKNGIINTINSELTIDSLNDTSTSTNLQKLTINHTVNLLNINVYTIYADILNINEVIVNIDSLNNGNTYCVTSKGETKISNLNVTQIAKNSKQNIGIHSNGDISIKNSNILVESTNPARGMNLNGQNIKISNCFTDVNNENGALYGAYIGILANTNNIIVSDSSFNVINKGSGSSYGIRTQGTGGSIKFNKIKSYCEGNTENVAALYVKNNGENSIVEINNGEYYATSLTKREGYGIVTFGQSKVSLNNTNCYGDNIGVCSNVNPIEINGGLFTSTNHIAYFGGDTIAKNAEFHIANLDKENMNAGYGLYVYSADENNLSTIDFYNCIIGEISDDDSRISDYTITAKRHQGYSPPKEVNFYDCTLYQGKMSMFCYNRVDKSTMPDAFAITKFNLYGNTKLCYKDGMEVPKINITNAINTWKNTENIKFENNAKNYARAEIKDENNLINLYYTCPDITQDKNIENYITADANVYDYR